MNNTKLHTDAFTVVTQVLEYDDSTSPAVDFVIDGSANLTDMISAFEKFLHATGYVLPKGGRLDFVFDEE